MHLDSAMERDFLKQDLGPALKAAGYSNVSLMILDDNRSMLPSWVDTVCWGFELIVFKTE